MCRIRIHLLIGLSLVSFATCGCRFDGSPSTFGTGWFGDSIKNGQAFDPRAREIEQRLGLSQELGYAEGDLRDE